MAKIFCEFENGCRFKHDKPLRTARSPPIDSKITSCRTTRACAELRYGHFKLIWPSHYLTTCYGRSPCGFVLLSFCSCSRREKEDHVSLHLISQVDCFEVDLINLFKNSYYICMNLTNFSTSASAHDHGMHYKRSGPTLVSFWLIHVKLVGKILDRRNAYLSRIHFGQKKTDRRNFTVALHRFLWNEWG